MATTYPKPHTDDELLSIRAVAREYGLRIRYPLTVAIEADEVVAYRPGKRTLLVWRSDVERWLDSKMVRRRSGR